ncbi:hypothetical protein [Pseudomonas serbica]|uniref:hypothetical protein n=1 Tax=Pseudomonas serbica TaxID=2965074 RepID=UPI00237B2F8A|nr:hypothetical protein [Pseudomonas serbica]
MVKKTFLQRVIDTVNKSGFLTIEVRDVEFGRKVHTIEAEFQEKAKPASNWPRKPGDPVLLIDEITSVSMDDLFWQARVKDVSPKLDFDEIAKGRPVSVMGALSKKDGVDPISISSPEGGKPKSLVFLDDVIATPVDAQALQDVVDYLKADKFELFEDDQPGLYPVPRTYRLIESTAERVSSTDVPSSDASIQRLLEKPVPDDDPRP